MAKTCCKKCGAELAPGSLKYLVTINTTADFDGVLPAEGGIEELEAFMAQIDREDPVKLESDVYQTQGFILCRQCKKEFLKDPLAESEEVEIADDDPKGRVH